MGSHEFEGNNKTERHRGNYTELIINDAPGIATAFTDRTQTERVHLALENDTLPPPLTGAKFEINPAGEVLDWEADTDTPRTIYATISLPEIPLAMQESLLGSMIVHLRQQLSLDIELVEHSIEDGLSVHNLHIDDEPSIQITCWGSGIGIRAFAQDTAHESNTALKHFYMTTVATFDAATAHFPSEKADDELYSVGLSMPVNEKNIAVIEVEKEWLPQHSYGNFDEIGGLFHAKERLMDIGLAWQYPEIAKEFGVGTSHFVLAGPPGTGKTTLINAFANQFDARVIDVKSSEIVNSYLGQSSKNLSLCFSNALAQAADGKVIVLLDEIDSIISKNSSQHREYIQTINTFKQELDALQHHPHASNLIFAGATNADKDDLDQAIVRSGRLEFIAAPQPNLAERMDIWSKLIYTPEELEAQVARLADGSNTDHVAGISIERLAELTEGMTGADFKQIMTNVNKIKFRRAAGFAASKGLINLAGQPYLRQVSQAELEQAIRQFGIA